MPLKCVQAFHNILQSTVGNFVTSIRGTPLWILLESLFHSVAGRAGSLQPKLLVLRVSALASHPDEKKVLKERFMLSTQPNQYVPSSLNLRNFVEPR